MRILFALPGFHRYDRGAEIALISIARELSTYGNAVTLLGSGSPHAQMPYRFIRAGSIRRERFHSCPSMPILRNETAYEELTFTPALLWRYKPEDYDLTVTCSYPFTNWILRRPTWGHVRPRHVFVTENGDWPAYSDKSEYRWFGCDGLVCTNPDYFERNRTRWRSCLIPNGVDTHRFKPGAQQRAMFNLPAERLVVLMVSALIPSKRVQLGIEAVSRIPNAHLVVAGDGPLRPSVEASAASLMPGRFTRVSVPAERMPNLYQSADAFLHLSQDESFGNVFLEALACGLPIVAHDSARTRWIVGDDQFLIDTNDSQSVTAAISSAADARQRGQSAWLARAATFSWKHVGEMYEAFFQTLLGG